MEVVSLLDLSLPKARDEFLVQKGYSRGAASAENEINVTRLELREFERFVQAMQNLLGRIGDTGLELVTGKGLIQINGRVLKVDSRFLAVRKAPFRSFDLLENIETQIVFDQAEKPVHLLGVFLGEGPLADVPEKLHHIAFPENRHFGGTAKFVDQAHRHLEYVRSEGDFVGNVAAEKRKEFVLHDRAVESVAGHRHAGNRQDVRILERIRADSNDGVVGGATAEVGD